MIDFAYEFCNKSVEEYYDRFVEIINQLVLLYVPMHMSIGGFFEHPSIPAAHQCFDGVLTN